MFVYKKHTKTNKTYTDQLFDSFIGFCLISNVTPTLLSKMTLLFNVFYQGIGRFTHNIKRARYLSIPTTFYEHTLIVESG